MSSSTEGEVGFTLAGTDTSFTSKSADVFGSLAALEKKHETVQEAMSREDKKGLIKDDPVLDIMGHKRDNRKPSQGNRKPSQGNRKDDRGNRECGKDTRDSAGFRVPQRPPPRSGRNRLPEHKRNPEKFQHYSLADTPEMSDRSNSSAALGFLNSLKKTREEDMEQDDDEDHGKVVFRKPVSSKDTPTEKTVTAGSGKLVMPEYVIGQKSSVKKSKAKHHIADGSKVDLGHLDEEDETGETKQDGSAVVTFKKISKKGQRRVRDEEEDTDQPVSGEGGTKRKAEDEEEEKEGTEIVRRDRAAERRKKSRGKIYQRQQVVDSASEDEEEWEEELKKAREEEKEEEETMEDMVVEGL